MNSNPQVKSFLHLLVFNIAIFKGIMNVITKLDRFYVHGTAFRDVIGEGAIYSGIVYIILGIISLLLYLEAVREQLCLYFFSHKKLIFSIIVFESLFFSTPYVWYLSDSRVIKSIIIILFLSNFAVIYLFHKNLEGFIKNK